MRGYWSLYAHAGEFLPIFLGGVLLFFAPKVGQKTSSSRGLTGMPVVRYKAVGLRAAKEQQAVADWLPPWS